MIEWILSSSVLICAVLLLRQIFLDKIPKRLQYALWLLVLLRLLIPGFVAESAASVGNVLSSLKERPVVQAASGDISTKEFYDHALYEVLGEHDYSLEVYSILPKNRQEAIVSEYQPQIEQKVVSYERASGIARFLMALWLTGVAGMGLWLLLSNLSFRRKLVRSREALCIDFPLPVYRSGAVSAPCLSGFFKPGIYLPDSPLDGEPLTCVLTHELTHYRHLDHLWSVARCVCLALHWYNPLVWIAAKFSRRDSELACDEATLASLGDRSRDCYGRTLIAMSCAKPTLGDYLLTATTMTEDRKSLYQRVRAIAKKPKVIFSAVAVMLILSLAVIGCTFTGASGKEIPTAESTVPFPTLETDSPGTETITQPTPPPETESTAVSTLPPETAAPTEPYHEDIMAVPMVRAMGMLYVLDKAPDSLIPAPPEGFVYLGLCYDSINPIPKWNSDSCNLPRFTELYASLSEPDFIYYQTADGYQRLIRAALVETELSKDDPGNTTPERYIPAFFADLMDSAIQNPYNQVGRLVFEQPEDVDLRQLFYNGFPEWSHQAVPLTDGEKAFLASHGWGEDKPMDNAERYPVSAMDERLQRFFGITFDQSHKVGLDRMGDYREQNQCYYHWLSDVRGFNITILSIDYQPDNNLYHISYQCDADLYPEVYRLTLKQKDHVFQILSNVLAE